MKRLLYLVTLIGALAISSGCTQASALGSVQAKFPDSTVVTISGSNSIFIIRKPDGSIWQACCSGTTNGVANPEVVRDIARIMDKPEAR